MPPVADPEPDKVDDPAVGDAVVEISQGAAEDQAETDPGPKPMMTMADQKPGNHYHRSEDDHMKENSGEHASGSKETEGDSTVVNMGQGEPLADNKLRAHPKMFDDQAFRPAVQSQNQQGHQPWDGRAELHLLFPASNCLSFILCTCMLLQLGGQGFAPEWTCQFHREGSGAQGAYVESS